MRRHLDIILASIAALLIGIGVDAGSVIYASASQTDYGTVLSPSAPYQPVAKTSPVRPESTRTVMVHGLLAQSTRYRIVSGDTLSGISGRTYGSYKYWPAIYSANKSTIKNPNLIYPGQLVNIPARPNRIPSAPTLTTQPVVKSGGHKAPTHSTPVTTVSSGQLSGTLGCGGLEALWIAAGGRQSAAFIAAEIAMAESGGRQYAHGPTNDFGYWQINGVHGAQATYNPLGNARAAVSISGDGTNWNPWTTYTSGAYRGKCSSLTVATKIGTPQPPVAGSSRELTALAWALTQAGKPYIWGGNGPYGYDCSGLVVAAFARVGISLPRTTQNMAYSGRLHRTYRPAKGDLVLWFGNGGAFHVEFYINSGETYGAHQSGKPIGYAGMWSAYHQYYTVG